jgi:hypothetical protein
MKSVLLILGGVIFGAFIGWWMRTAAASVPAAQPAAPSVDVAALSAEVERLKSIAPTQSHVMADTGAQFSSLWFAAQQKNWELATFLFNETRGRIRWTVRINPKPKAAGSQDEVDLQSIFDAVDKDVLTPLKAAIDAKDPVKFETAYRDMIVSCYGCHKSTNRAFLRPGIPASPGLAALNFDPNAAWPQ